MNILITGYHGTENCGDDAILLAMKNTLKNIDDNINITVVSSNTQSTKNNFELNAIWRFDVIKLIKNLMSCDILLCGGGSLLQDKTSTRSLLYYLAVIQLAKLFKKKVMLFSNGVGPINRKINKMLVKSVINQVDLITLREQSSGKLLKSLGVNKPPIYITADPAFTLKGISREKAQQILKSENIPTDKPLVAVSVREWMGKEKFIPKLAQICDYIVKIKDCNVLFIPMQYTPDLRISKEIQNKMKNVSYALNKKHNFEEIIGVIGECELTLAMRLHTLIFSALQRIPVIGIIYDPKVEHYSNILGMPPSDYIEKLDVEDMKALIDNVIANKEKYTLILDQNTEKLEKDTLKTEEYLRELIKK